MEVIKKCSVIFLILIISFGFTFSVKASSDLSNSNIFVKTNNELTRSNIFIETSSRIKNFNTAIQNLKDKSVQRTKKIIYDEKNSYFVDAQIEAMKEYQSPLKMRIKMQAVLDEMFEYSEKKKETVNQNSIKQNSEITYDKLEFDLQNLICVLSSVVKLSGESKYIQALEESELLLEKLRKNKNVLSIYPKYKELSSIR